MDAASELAFDQLASQAGRQLWPGVVTIGGTDYDATVTRQKVLVTMRGSAGVMEVDGIRVEISKDDLEECPISETPVAHEGHVFFVKETAGHGAQDSDWFLVCAKNPANN